jgi:hypothetical protein
MVSPGFSSRWLVVLALVGLAPVTARADRAGPAGTAAAARFEQILGIGQAEATDNACQVRVAWNARVGRYERTLVRQGVLPQRAGHVLGELCWTFDIAPRGVVLNELRRDRTSRREAWRRSGIRFEPSTPPRLVADDRELLEVSWLSTAWRHRKDQTWRLLRP